MTDDVDLGQYNPIPAGGTGAERFDDPALFYLTHQAAIEEWHGLRRTVSEALNSWLETTGREALAALAGERSLLLSTVNGPKRWVHLIAHPESMPVHNSRPIIGVGLGWSRDSVNPISNPPFACVRRSAIGAGKASAGALLEAGGRQFRSERSLKGRDDEVWPIFTNIAAQQRWWTDLDRYLAEIVKEVKPFMDGLVGSMAAAIAAGQAWEGNAESDDEDAEDS